MTYLDHAATTPVLAVVAGVVAEQLTRVGNPSSLHAAGRRARQVVEESREAIAEVLGVGPGDVVFTSGGTEADNLAVKGLYWARRDADARRRRILVADVEHHAVLDPVAWLGAHEGAEIVWLEADSFGRVDPEQVRRELAAAPEAAALVSVMWANNEVGTVQPIAELAQLCAEFAVPFHSDAIQAVGHLPVDGLVPDALSLSGHKFGGPHGVGALVVRRDLSPVPLLHGGGQERDVRSGSLDTPGIAGLAAALVASTADRVERTTRVAELRDELESRVLQQVPDAIRNGDPNDRLPGISHLSFPGCEGDALLMLLDAHGIECSTGSACSAGVPEASHVLLAMGVDEATARGSLRFSLGHNSNSADIDALLMALPEAVARARRAGAARSKAVH
jgi:cysteine desulfurase